MNRTAKILVVFIVWRLYIILCKPSGDHTKIINDLLRWKKFGHAPLSLTERLDYLHSC